MEVTRRWHAEHAPFPLNFFLPGSIQRQQLERLRLVRGDEELTAGEEVEKEVSGGGDGSGRVGTPKATVVFNSLSNLSKYNFIMMPFATSLVCGAYCIGTISFILFIQNS